MELQFERPVEAMAAISWIICSADDVGSTAEHNFLHQHVRTLKEFEDMSSSEFSSLLASTRTKLFSNLAHNGLCLTPPAVDTVISSAKAVLNDDQRVEAYRMAVGLAKTDGLVQAEQEILNKLRSRFSISFDSMDN